MPAYETLTRSPGAFRGLTGMTPAEFGSPLTVFRDQRRRKNHLEK